MFSKVYLYWNNFSLLGTKGLDAGKARRVVLTNRLAIGLSVIGIGFSLAWGFQLVFTMVWANLLVTAALLTIPWMNRKGHWDLSRFSLVFFLSSFFFIFCGMTGVESSSHLMFYTLTAFTCLIFESKEKYKIIICATYPIILLSILMYTDFRVFPHQYMVFYSFRTVSIIISFFLVSLSIITLIRASEKIEKENQQILDQHIKDQELLDAERARAIYSGRMAALGEMAGGIAHEINSPLSVITMLSEQMINRLPHDRMTKEQVIESAEKINNTANRIAEIVKSLRSFSRTGDGLPFRDSDVKQIIHETLVLCKERFRSKDILLQFNIPDEIATVYCRQIEISQVLLNLLNNACDALEGKDNPVIEISITQQKDKVLIGVADNGAGIEPAIHEKIFSPFFTTKDVGKGTGLGLSISKGLMEANFGNLYLDTKDQKTRFVIELATTPNKRPVT